MIKIRFSIFSDKSLSGLEKNHMYKKWKGQSLEPYRLYLATVKNIYFVEFIQIQQERLDSDCFLYFLVLEAVVP